MQIIPDIKESDSSLRKTGISLLLLAKWIILGLIVGIIVGFVGAIFAHLLTFANIYRHNNPYVLLLLPLAGILIVYLYHFFNDHNDTGTDLIIKAITANESIPIFKTPLIIIATFLTHLCGGSAGREGAALQFGGSLGYNIGKVIKLCDDDKKIMTMSGMAAAFSSLFGTPIAAAIFSIELSSVGAMHYAALVPSVAASLVALYVAKYFGVGADEFFVKIVPELTAQLAIKSVFIAIIGAFIGIMFCLSIRYTRKAFYKIIKNSYIRVICGGLIIIGLSYVFKGGYYNGAGIDVIEMAFDGESPYIAFLIKMIFTAITLGSGFKGGEIVPTLYIGATFGRLYASIVGFPNQLAVALGMLALFCSVTNCPIASLLIAFKLFGYEGAFYYVIVTAISYAISGYDSLYGSQRIKYSKFKYK